MMNIIIALMLLLQAFFFYKSFGGLSEKGNGLSGGQIWEKK